jgi:hypothetical protein
MTVLMKVSVERWWNDTDRGKLVWSVGRMILTGELNVERRWNYTDKEK